MARLAVFAEFQKATLCMLKIRKATFKLSNTLLTPLLVVGFLFTLGLRSKDCNPTETVVATPQTSKLRYGLINRHPGTAADFSHVANYLNFSFSQFDPKVLYENYGMTHLQAVELNEARLSDFFCDSFDIVVVIDTIPDARFLFERFDQEMHGIGRHKPCGIKRLIMHITNRFDYDVGNIVTRDREPYLEMLQRISKIYPEKIIWTANNRWEERYMHLEMLKVSRDDKIWLPNVKLIRSLGIATVPSKEIIKVPESKAKLPCLYHHDSIGDFPYMVKRFANISIVRLPHR